MVAVLEWRGRVSAGSDGVLCKSYNLITELHDTTYSCGWLGLVPAWFRLVQPGNIIPVPKTLTLLGVGILCLLQWSYERLFLKRMENIWSCVHCAFSLTSVPLHPHTRMDHTIWQRCRQGRRESSWVSTFFDFLSIITNCTYSTAGCSNAFTFFQSCVACNFFSIPLPFAVLTGFVLGYVDLCISFNKTKNT
jgi:hypothetical protein